MHIHNIHTYIHTYQFLILASQGSVESRPAEPQEERADHLYTRVCIRINTHPCLINGFDSPNSRAILHSW